MLKFLKILVPAGAGTVSVLTLAYVMADQFVADIPAPLREMIAVQPAQAQDVPAETVVMAAADLAQSRQGGFGLGRTALPEEVAAWNTDVRPDGLGLPVGSGDVYTGEELFVEKCSSCHGDFGEAVGRWPVLAGGQGTLLNDDPVKTVGSYWPYLSTVFDYVHRAMPFGEAESLSADEVYAITAYILYVNDVVGDDFELSNENFTEVRLPNEPNFIDDDRLTTEFPLFVREPCMENCKDAVAITMHASNLDVTPGDATDNVVPVAAEAMADPAPEEVVPEVVVADAAAPEVAAPEEVMTAAIDPALVDAGASVFRKCQACHQVGDGAVNRTGPQLNGLLGRTVGSVEGFNYSAVFVSAHDAAEVWTEESLAAYLANPRGAMPGTKMSFAGLKTDADIAAVLAYLQANSAE